MSRSGKRQRGEELAPALFPFLAVLLCTMGSLVLVLVLVVSQASASAKQSLEASQEKLLEVSDVVELVSDEMLARREQQQKAIDNRRSQLAAVEDHINRLVKELSDMESVAKAIDEQATTGDEQRRAQKEKLAALEQQVARTQAELEAKHAEQAAKPPAFAIVPYQGKSGTTRRPIYLECTSSGVVIQPEGTLISLEDLKPPHGPGNPLDASLRVIRSAYQRLDPTASSQVSPYPLLLVRPDGIRSYVLARAAMSGWDDQFGYELIDQEMPLAFPPSLPGLNAQLASNLVAARQRQSALIAAMPRRYGSESVWEDALEDIGADPNEGLGGPKTGGQAFAADDWSAVDRVPLSQAGPAWQMVEEYSRVGQAGSPGQRLASADQPAGSGTNAPTNANQAATPNGPLSRHDAKLAASSTTDWKSGGGDVLETGNSQGPGGSGPEGPPAALGASGAPAAAAPSATASAVPGLPGSPTPSASLSSDGQTPVLSFNQSPSPNDPVNRNQTTGRESQGGNQPPQLDLGPRSAKPSKADDQKPTAMSRSWTTRRRVTNGTAISRPMTVVVMPDRWFVMKDDRTDQVEKVITLQSGPAYARQALEAAINDRIESWGIAVAGGHWEPKLQVQVAPQAELSSQRFQKIIEESGLELELRELR